MSVALQSLVMVERTRKRLLNVRMNEIEIAMLLDLSERTGLSQSDVIRQLVRQAHAEQPMRGPKPSKRSKR